MSLSGAIHITICLLNVVLMKSASRVQRKSLIKLVVILINWLNTQHAAPATH